VPIDVSASKLTPGFGEGVTSVLFTLCKMTVDQRKFKKPVIRDDTSGFGGEDVAELDDEFEGQNDVADMVRDAEMDDDDDIDDDFEFAGQVAGGGKSQKVNEEDML